MLLVRVSAALLLCAGLIAGEWPQWRGPRRDGSLESVRLPAELPHKLVRGWSVRVGEGHSSPVLAGGKLYVFARERDQETLYAIDPASGKVLWKQSYAAPYQVNSAAASHGPGPKSTPAVQAGKVVTLGISGILSAWDSGDGHLLWRKEFSREFKSTSPGYGTASSPVMDGGLVIANVGGHDSGAMAAFDLNSGAVKWSNKSDGPGYASPIITEMGGVRQVVTQTQQYIAGVRADNGEPLWRVPFKTPYEQNIVTPVRYNDFLILAGLDNPTMAIKVIKDGSVYRTEKAWENGQATMYMSSPVPVGDLLFGFTNKNRGQLFCQDAKTGRVLWTGPPRQGENAALTTGGGWLFAMKDDGELLVVKATGAGFEPLRKYQAAESAVWAHPVVTDAGIIVKDTNSVTLWGWK